MPVALASPWVWPSFALGLAPFHYVPLLWIEDEASPAAGCSTRRKWVFAWAIARASLTGLAAEAAKACRAVLAKLRIVHCSSL
jgi:hypothetical protein